MTISANASDNVGVTRVEFYDGASLVVTDTSSPYSYAWGITSAANGTHNWTAKAYDAAGNVGISITLALTVNIGTADTTPPTAPSSLSATAASTSQINLSWTASTDNVGVTGYRVERCQGGSCTNFAQIATPTGTSYNNTALTANTTYRYRVRATDAAGNLSGYSNIASATTQQTADTTPPTAPSNLAATAAGASQINLSWTASTDAVGVTGYRVERCQGGSCTNFAQIATPTGTTYNDTGLTANTTYRYRTRATDAAGNLSGYSNIASASTGQATACANPAKPNTSINSTSQDGCPQSTVPQQAQVPNTTYSVLAINDLGMHCGDLDTRIASILPPYNVLHAQVVQKGATPTLNPSGVSVAYSAVSNPNDPVLSQSNVLSSVTSQGVYKTNFWDTLNAGAYNPFYPTDITPPAIGADTGLPVPDSALLPTLQVAQQSMPGIQGPYTSNDPQAFARFDSDIQFFPNFSFGYTATVNWFAAEGIPLSTFDDFGRENPYPLMRVQAKQGNTVLATIDTVTPISGEANCQGCHAASADGGNGSATTAVGITSPQVSINDPSGNDVPSAVSVEWASDHNILKLHDMRNGTSLITGTTEDFPTAGATSFRPVVCQTCHYTPALDLAQVGPNDVNGRQQSNNQSMSRVMHNHHGQLTSLFPPIPAPVQAADGTITNQAARLAALDQSCYQCHPGKRTKCLRGAMFNGNMLCSDCHGGMTQVGNDFSRNKPGGSFILAGDFYTNANTPRVPWANEPSCGSCHTGDAVSNLAGTTGTVVNNRDTNGYKDALRLRQAYRTGDTKATPIVPTNKRFAEDVTASSNPKLYRVSVGGQATTGGGQSGHSGIFCEACHGSTHAEWPNANPNANDNVTANQLQGHSGFIADCSTCHGSASLGSTLGGPHGLHPIAATSTPWSSSSVHRSVNGSSTNTNYTTYCQACHGGTSRSTSCGTPLSRVLANRTFSGQTVAKGHPIGCAVCHNTSYWTSTCANQ